MALKSQDATAREGARRAAAPASVAAEPESAHGRPPAAARDSESIARVQGLAGNMAIGRALAADGIRPKLTVSQPGDPEEAEADRIADAVVSQSPLPGISRKCAACASGQPCGRCEEETAHMKHADGAAAAPRPATVGRALEAVRGGGDPLPRDVRTAFEPHFPHDLAAVRIHTDPASGVAARGLNARAFTIGDRIAFAPGEFRPYDVEGQRLLAHELVHVAQGSGAAVRRDTAEANPDTRASQTRQPPASSHADTLSPRAEDLIAARYPHLMRVLLPEHLKAVQDVINWRLQSQKLNQEITDFDRQEREQAEREGMSGDSYRYLSSYNDKFERLQRKQKEAPNISRIEVDTSKLIDPSILDEQEWNVLAEREFRERWVRVLASKPTILYLFGNHNIEDVFQGIFWNGVALPTEGGLITWNKLLEIPGVFLDYNSRVLHSPVAVAAEEYLGQLRHWYDIAESEYDSERKRKSEYPVVSAISAFFSSDIDWNAASRLLPEGKSFKDMSPFEAMEFLSSVDAKQLERVKRVLPSDEAVLSIYKHLLNVDTAVTLRKYEAALITMPLVADEIEEMYRQVMTYRQRMLEGASTVVIGLQAVRMGCNIVLTVGGGVMGKAYGLVGISAGSAAGAGIGTFTQETAMQLSQGHLDPGSVMYKTGKDAAMAFIGSMIGGALASKFVGVLGPKLATVIPNEGVRLFVIGRVADATSGLLTTPIEVTVTGMLEGEWPKSMDDLLDMVAKNVVASVIIGSGVDVVTGVPNLKGKAWESLVASDVGTPQGGETGPLAGLSQAEIDAALHGEATTGTMVQGPAGAETGQSLVSLEIVSRLNDEVRALVAGRGTTAPPSGAAFERSQAEVEWARQILANPDAHPNEVNHALEVVVERAAADYRALLLGRHENSARETVLTADALRGACGEGRDVTADSIASLTIGSRSPLVVHRIQAAHLGIEGAQHAFTVIITPEGRGFLVDPTFAQFADQIGGRTFTSQKMLSDPRAVMAARNLLRDGFVPLTPANARDYALGLGAQPNQVGDVAARIVAGDASVLTEVVLNGTVTRISARPGEAHNTLAMPHDVESPQAGTIYSVERILARLGPNDPARAGLASLRDRLIMIAAKQPPIPH
jgi:hypothetical protein